MTKIQMRTRMSVTGRIIAGCCYGVLTLLSACGNSEQPVAAAPEAAAPTSKSTNAAAQASNPLANMVKAVPAAAGEQPVELRFEIAKAPALNELFDVNLNVLALADVSGLDLKVNASPNLTLVAGKEGSFGALKTGESVKHTLQVRAAAVGISVLDAQLVAMVNGQPVTANFAIPIALAEPPAAAAATAGK